MQGKLRGNQNTSRTNWPLSVFHAMEKEKNGRLWMRWIDGVVETVGLNWKNEAQDRWKWAALTDKAHIQEWGELSEEWGGDGSSNQPL